MNINLDKPKTLEFNVDTRGCKEEDLKGYLRFVFEGVEYGFPATFDSGLIKVKVPAFRNILSNRLSESISMHKEVTVTARLDIVANNEAFVTPWENELDIEVPVDIQVKEEKKSVLDETKINVKDPQLFEAYDEAVKTSKIKGVLEKDLEKKEPEEPEKKEDPSVEEEEKEEEETPLVSAKSRLSQALAEIYVKEK